MPRELAFVMLLTLVDRDRQGLAPTLIGLGRVQGYLVFFTR